MIPTWLHFAIHMQQIQVLTIHSFMTEGKALQLG
jgi:hypothetical protein